MTLAVRTAFASAAAGAGAFALLLAGRFEGTLATVLILALATRAAGSVAVGDDEASSSMGLQAAVVPAWALAIAAAAYRAGSGALVDVRGAHAVAGLAVARGPALTVLGCCLCVVALACAIAATSPAKRSLATAAPRLEILGTAAQVALAVAAFAGPAVADPVDAVAWVGGAAGVGVAAGAIRSSVSRTITVLGANALALAGLVLVLVGGRP